MQESYNKQVMVVIYHIILLRCNMSYKLCFLICWGSGSAVERGAANQATKTSVVCFVFITIRRIFTFFCIYAIRKCTVLEFAHFVSWIIFFGFAV